MDKRYQVFVSSTYADLKEERQHVIQALMKMECIPAGMELFPAMDEEQLKFIKRVIDDCDYYLLIIGGRYGSTNAEGISYTEKEFDYAIEKGMKVIALVHSDPGSIARNKTDRDPELEEKLNKFKEKVMTDRIVEFWEDAKELPAKVMASLMTAMKIYPSVGWVRGSNVSSEVLLSEINELRKEKEQLEIKLSQLQTEQPIANLESLESKFPLEFHEVGEPENSKVIEVTWLQIFELVAPVMFKSGKIFSWQIEEYMSKFVRGNFRTLAFPQLDNIAIQLRAHNLIYVYPADSRGDTYWQLTELGERIYVSSRAIKSTISS